MKFKEFIKYGLENKRYIKKGIKEVSKAPFKKIIIGTIAIIFPGGIMISGAYIAIQEIKQRYELYIKSTKEKNEKPKPFVVWINENYAEYLKEKKEIIVYSVSDSVKIYRKKIKQYTVGKVSSLMKKNNKI
jgi:hypothetical protein